MEQHETEKLNFGYFGGRTGAASALNAAAKLGNIIKAESLLKFLTIFSINPLQLLDFYSMKSSRLDQFITSRVPIAHPENTAKQVLDSIIHADWEETQYVFVINDDKHLKGYFGLHKLLKCDANEQVKHLIEDYHSVNTKHSLEYVATHAIHLNISVMPVTNEQGVFLGIIPPQTIIETLRKEHIEDMHKMAGIQKETALARKAMKEPPLRSVRHRLPWLLVGLGGSFISSYLMTNYEHMLSSYIMLSFFLPGIIYLADAIGTQTETLVIRGLSLSWGRIDKILRIELWTGLLIGIILGILSIPFVLFISQDIHISLIVSGSIVAAGTVATTIGMMLPWFLHRYGIDPAFGSGPLATIIQDILSILIYLVIAQTILG